MSPLPTTQLGGSSLEVSRIALGSWRTFERMPRADAERLLAHALAAGVNFLDDARYDDETGTAPMRTGFSEVLFGELLRATGASRPSLAIANKLWWEFWPREGALAELEGSLERTALERIDLLYSSTLPANLPVPVAIEQIATVLASGLIGAWGVVNWSAEHLAQGAKEAERLGIPMPCAVQLPYSLAQLDWVEDPEMTSALDSAGASLVASAVLAGGALSGKYAAGGAGRLSAELDDPGRQRAFAIGAELRPVAAQLDTTPATLATAFTLTDPRAACALIGATRPDQVDAALDAVALAERLTSGDLAHLRAIAATLPE